MADYVQQLNSLASTFALSQLKLDGEGQLEKRNIFEALGHKIADAFRSLSSAGRTAIAARNGELLSAMQKAVDESKHHMEADVRTASAKLATTLDKLQSHINKGAHFAHIKGELTNDPRFKAMPERSQRALIDGLNTIHTGKGSDSQKLDAMERLKNDFFGIKPSNYDMEKALGQFSTDLVDFFLTSEQQKYIDDSGLHASFFKDAARGMFSIGDTTPQKGLPHQVYANTLMDWLPKQHHHFLPFISMMASQAGINSAKAFLPHMSGLSDDPNCQHLVDVGVVANKDHNRTHVNLTLDGNTLRLTTIFDEAFLREKEQSSPPVLHRKGTATMTIDLAAEPRVETVRIPNTVEIEDLDENDMLIKKKIKIVEHKEVFIPKFTIENGEVHFETPTA